MKNADYNKAICWLMLAGIKGIGPVGLHRLIDVFGDAERCMAADIAELEAAVKSGCPQSLIKAVSRGREAKSLRNDAERIIDKCIAGNVKIVTLEDDEYPDRFREIDQMPKVLYAKGNLRINDVHTSVGVVGARRCTKEGRQEAITVAAEAAYNRKAVISGMAKGIDSYAHTACIKTGGYTIAVLGGSPDICYPKEHQKLYECIAETGCIISEYPPVTEPRQYMFPRRNHLIAALADVLYVIDAGRNSGTNSTVAAAERYGRCVKKFG